MSRIKDNNIYYCDICGRQLPYKISAYGHIICGRHRYQIKKYGKILDTTARTQNDKNEYKIIGDKVIVYTYDTKNIKNSEFIIDLEDLNRVLEFKWRVGNGRVYSRKNGKALSLSRFILNIQDDEFNFNKVIDHIDGNPLNNSKDNLRICTQSENSRNKHLDKTQISKSGYVGVSYNRKRYRWYSQVSVKRKPCYVYSNKSIKNAVYARYIAEKILYKEYTEKEEHKRKYEFTKDLPQNIKDEIERKVTSKINEVYKEN